MSRALRKALIDFYPSLEPVHLTDYKVRVLTPEEATGATVRVLIAHARGSDTWNTVGVSHNIIEASWQALADGMRYFLMTSQAKSMPAA
jgi:2-isopropylmalate synthase